jgi:hypothetical protein
VLSSLPEAALRWGRDIRGCATTRCTIIVACKHRPARSGFLAAAPHFAGLPPGGRVWVRRREGAVVVVGGVLISAWRAVVAGSVATLVVGTGLAAAATPAAVGSGAVSTRLSVHPGAQEANDTSFDPAISADGRFVVFASGASNLVAGDTNNADDVFVRDRRAQVTRRISVS